MTSRHIQPITLTALFLLAGCLPTGEGDNNQNIIIEDDAGVEQDASSGDDASIEEDTGAPDVGEDVDADEPPEELAVGSACTSDADCPGGACYTDSFAGGYCSKTCGSDSECPGDALCLQGACLDGCASDAECRDAYECISNTACLPERTTLDAAVGAECASDSDCGVDGTCIADFPGGFCSAECDELNLCPEGSECVDLGEGIQACLTSCTRDDMCRDGYLCSAADLCAPEPTADDYFSDFELFHPCGGALWGAWTNGADFNVNEIQLLDASGDLLSTRTFFNSLEFWDDEAEYYELFEDVSLDTQERYTVRFKLTDGTIIAKEAAVADDLAEGTNLLEVRSVDTIGQDLEITLRPSFDGSIQRATVYDAGNCQQARVVLFTPISLSSGSSARVTFSGSFPASTPLQLVLEGRNSDIGYSFYDVLDFTTP